MNAWNLCLVDEIARIFGGFGVMRDPNTKYEHITNQIRASDRNFMFENNATLVPCSLFLVPCSSENTCPGPGG
jgi:hypothetical protein